MAERVALVTNVTEYTGLPSALALAAAGFTVVCHDRGFPEVVKLPQAKKRFVLLPKR